MMVKIGTLAICFTCSTFLSKAIPTGGETCIISILWGFPLFFLLSCHGGTGTVRVHCGGRRGFRDCVCRDYTTNWKVCSGIPCHWCHFSTRLVAKFQLYKGQFKLYMYTSFSFSQLIQISTQLTKNWSLDHNLPSSSSVLTLPSSVMH